MEAALRGRSRGAAATSRSAGSRSSTGPSAPAGSSRSARPLGFYLAKRAARLRVLGIEPAKELIQASERRFGVEVRAGFVEDATSTPAARRGLRLACLEHIPDPCRLLQPAARIAPPPGAASLTWRFRTSRAPRRVTAVPGWPHLDPAHHVGHYTPAALRRLVEHAGFTVVPVDTLSGIAYYPPHRSASTPRGPSTRSAGLAASVRSHSGPPELAMSYCAHRPRPGPVPGAALLLGLRLRAPWPTRTGSRRRPYLGCTRCGLAFAPERSAEELRGLYDGGYFAEYVHGESYDGEARQRRWENRGRMQLVPRYAAAGRLLDVGCAQRGLSGSRRAMQVSWFAAWSRRRRPRRVAGARGLDVITGTLKDVPLAAGSLEVESRLAGPRARSRADGHDDPPARGVGAGGAHADRGLDAESVEAGRERGAIARRRGSASRGPVQAALAAGLVERGGLPGRRPPHLPVHRGTTARGAGCDARDWPGYAAMALDLRANPFRAPPFGPRAAQARRASLETATPGEERRARRSGSRAAAAWRTTMKPLLNLSSGSSESTTGNPGAAQSSRKLSRVQTDQCLSFVGGETSACRRRSSSAGVSSRRRRTCGLDGGRRGPRARGDAAPLVECPERVGEMLDDMRCENEVDGRVSERQIVARGDQIDHAFQPPAESLPVCRAVHVGVPVDVDRSKPVVVVCRRADLDAEEAGQMAGDERGRRVSRRPPYVADGVRNSRAAPEPVIEVGGAARRARSIVRRRYSIPSNRRRRARPVGAMPVTRAK